MATQLLIYESAVPVSSARHGKCSVEARGNYEFSRGVNSVPLMAVEFRAAAAEYPIVFAASGDELMPVVILGVRQNQNLYLTPDDGWEAKYVPAFIRRYPFVFSKSDDGKTFTLCVDESYPAVNFTGKGRRLFTDDGKPSPYVDDVLKFLQQYGAQFERTQAFCRKLKELNLLEPMQAQFTLGSGEKMSLTGFMVASREKIKAIPGDKLAELAKTDELELLYLHLQSMGNFTNLKDRLAQIETAKARASGAPPSGDAGASGPASAAAEEAGNAGA